MYDMIFLKFYILFAYDSISKKKEKEKEFQCEMFLLFCECREGKKGKQLMI